MVKPVTGRIVAFHARIALLIFLAAILLTASSCQQNSTVEDPVAAIDKMYQDYQKSFPDVPEITASELADRMDQGGVTVVDVRTPREWDVSRIPGAIPIEEFEKNPASYKDQPVIAYCTIGYRSGQFAKRLQEQGFDASNLTGSILSWVHEGYEVVDNDGETNRVHVYGPQWDLLPPEYESVW
jgi:rhodanese-related sulfurtransferase